MNNKQIIKILAALVIGFIFGNLFSPINISNQSAGVLKTNLSEKSYIVDSSQRVSTAPWLDTTAPTNVTSTSATLNGLVNPNGDYTEVWFYVFDASGSNVVQQTIHTPAGNGTSTISFSHNISGLTPNTNYIYEICASTSTIGITCASVEPLRTKRGAIPIGPNHN